MSPFPSPSYPWCSAFTRSKTWLHRSEAKALWAGSSSGQAGEGCTTACVCHSAHPSFQESWLQDPSVPRLLCTSSSFSATCQKVSLAFHIALMEFSLIQQEQHWWKGPQHSGHLSSVVGVYWKHMPSPRAVPSSREENLAANLCSAQFTEQMLGRIKRTIWTTGEVSWSWTSPCQVIYVFPHPHCSENRDSPFLYECAQ